MWSNPIAHGLPLGPGGHADPADVVIVVALGVALAVAAGLLAAASFSRRRNAFHAGAALSFGGLLFLFFDLLKESSSLGQGLVATPLLPLFLIAVFALGFLILPAADAVAPGRPSGVTWAWIGGIGLHTLAEGWIIGTEATSADLFGAPFGTASFLLHKVIEAWTIVFVGRRALSRADMIGAAVLLGGLAFLGTAAGHRFGPSLAPTFLFASGAGAIAAAALYVARGLRVDMRTSGLVLVGFIAVFAAGLLHEI